MRSVISARIGLTSAPGITEEIRPVIRDSVFRSARNASSAPGYCTFTATVRPSDHTALCTCPILADAAGVSSKERNRCRHCVPSC
ncbi:Uncharacterised protein [Mycobacteroides abscessus subsp. abscessus]|nr:Uncharacterised protein [Mycobacteroides abscessus subsp. abscessus]